MKKGRILHFSPAMTSGGAERMVADVLREMAPDWEQALLLLYPPSSHPLFFEPEQPLHILHQPGDRFSRLLMVARYIRLIGRFRPQIIHAHQWRPCEVARYLHRFFPHIPVICTPHALILDQARAGRERAWQNQAAAIVAVSEACLQNYQQHLSKRENLVKIPLGIDTAYFQPGDKGAARQALFPDLGPGAQIGLMVSRLHPGKNHRQAFQAIQALRAAGIWGPADRLICLGEGDADPLAHEVQQAGLAQQVRFIPPQTEMPLYYQAADFLLHPSLYESFGLASLEAAACACPVILSAAANTEGLFQDQISGLVHPTGDLGALIRGLKQFLGLASPERQAMAERARAKVLANYQLQHMVKGHEALYSSRLSVAKLKWRG
jgi:glycosyltransferase involved in cell wall biosynthesis